MINNFKYQLASQEKIRSKAQQLKNTAVLAKQYVHNIKLNFKKVHF